MAVVKVQTGLRLDESTYEKLKHIASRENRSLNNLAEFIIKRYLEDYESLHGKIVPEIDEQLSPPAR